MIEKYSPVLAEEIKSEMTGNLEEYTLDSTIGRDLGEFYKSIVRKVLGVRVWVCVYEISDGKYQVDFHFENYLVLSLFSKASDTSEIIQSNILQNIIKPYIDRVEKGRDKNGDNK